MRKLPKNCFGELSGVGKQTQMSTKGFEGTKWTSQPLKWGKKLSMERICTSTQRLWGS